MKTNKTLQAAQTVWLNRYANELWLKYHKTFSGLRAFKCPESCLE